jgi:hypothetical protein
MGSAHQRPEARRLAKAQVQFQIPVRSLFLILPIFSVSKCRPVQCSQKFPLWDFPTLYSQFLVARCFCGSTCFPFSLYGLQSSFHRESASYHEAKQAATTYQAAKRCLIGPNAPFAGWIVSGEEWESFDAHGELRSKAQT